MAEAEPDKAPDAARATGELIGPDDPDIQAALKTWKETGQAPIIRKDEFIQYPEPALGSNPSFRWRAAPRLGYAPWRCAGEWRGERRLDCLRLIAAKIICR